MGREIKKSNIWIFVFHLITITSLILTSIIVSKLDLTIENHILMGIFWFVMVNYIFNLCKCYFVDMQK